MVGSESHVECLDLMQNDWFLKLGAALLSFGSHVGSLDFIVRCCSACFMVGP